MDQEDASAEAKTRKKKQTKKAEQDEEEYIRCVCGSSHDEAWIQCDRCQAWQHNVCMGMSIFTEDLKGAYYCERCEPGNHKELLDAMARGEKLWEERQKRHQEDQNAKKRRGRKPKARQGDEDSTAAKSSPTPEPKAGGVSKRRIEDGPEKDAKVCIHLCAFICHMLPVARRCP